MLVKLLGLLFVVGIALSQNSWQAFVDDKQLVGDRLANNAAILGHDGEIWAKSNGFEINEDEGKEVNDHFNNPFSREPLVIGGESYQILRKDGVEMIGRKGSGGFVAAKTTTAVILATYDKRTNIGTLHDAVAKLADFFNKLGY